MLREDSVINPHHHILHELLLYQRYKHKMQYPHVKLILDVETDGLHITKETQVEIHNDSRVVAR